MSLAVHKTHSENVDMLKAKVDRQKVGLLCRTMVIIIPLDLLKDIRGGTIAITEDKPLKSVPTRLPVCYTLRSTISGDLVTDRPVTAEICSDKTRDRVARPFPWF